MPQHRRNAYSERVSIRDLRAIIIHKILIYINNTRKYPRVCAVYPYLYEYYIFWHLLINRNPYGPS